MIAIFYSLKKKKIDISVIIPIFNGGKNLFKCLKSVINQSLKSIEIICIDDGSTDNSLQILKKIKDFDKRLIIFWIFWEYRFKIKSREDINSSRE